MATTIEGLLPLDLNQLVKESKVLVVGAGGIGCELLKNLVLTGFSQIHIVSFNNNDFFDNSLAFQNSNLLWVKIY